MRFHISSERCLFIFEFVGIFPVNRVTYVSYLLLDQQLTSSHLSILPEIYSLLDPIHYRIRYMIQVVMLISNEGIVYRIILSNKFCE